MTSPQSLPEHCPLCGELQPAVFHRDRSRKYLRCGRCGLVFVPPSYFLPPEEEKTCYDLHQNRPDDPAYRRFLGRLFDPLRAKLPPGATGLDFGSGPGPTLSLMFAEAGFPTAIFDPFYAPNHEVWRSKHDFITASEVVEHLHRPAEELDRLWNSLTMGGWLGLMTKRVRDQASFAAWHYKNDPTHVVFFADETFAWLATHWRAKLEIVGADVVLLQKCEPAAGD